VFDLKHFMRTASLSPLVMMDVRFACSEGAKGRRKRQLASPQGGCVAMFVSGQLTRSFRGAVTYGNHSLTLPLQGYHTSSLAGGYRRFGGTSYLHLQATGLTFAGH
jgi:hypothetical protein